MQDVGRQREQTIFLACLDMPSSERDAYLQSACAGDTDLRDRVWRLLAAHAQARDCTLFTTLQTALSPHLSNIGPYRLIRILGEGGMGTVYEAEQLEPVRRRVALKLVKLGMDTREV